MTPPRFFVDGPLSVGRAAALPHAVTRHALRVLRLRQGAVLTLFDGRGGEYAAQLVHAREPEAEVQVVRFDAREAESPWRFVVAQGLSSGDRMDWTVEKAVEVGARAIVPLATARSATRLSAERGRARRAHWQALAVAASAQCGRNRIATIEEPAGFDEWLAACPPAALRIVCLPGGSPLVDLAPVAAGESVVVLAGPEGGFDAREEKAAIDAGFRPTTLGPRILRTETAAPVAIAMLSAVWESRGI